MNNEYVFSETVDGDFCVSLLLTSGSVTTSSVLSYRLPWLRTWGHLSLGGRERYLAIHQQMLRGRNRLKGKNQCGVMRAIS